MQHKINNIAHSNYKQGKCQIKNNSVKLLHNSISIIKL